MHGNFTNVVVFCLSLLCAPVSFAVAEKYTLDPNHTYVMFHINHFGFSNSSGKWMTEGTIALDKDKIQNSTVNATIHVNEIVTGIAELDKHLKSEGFFDVKKFPTATFVSNKVDRAGKGKALVHGILTLHGVSKPVTLNVKVNKIGVNPINNKMTAGFTAYTTIKRSDFGMTELLPGLGDEIKLDIEAEGSK